MTGIPAGVNVDSCAPERDGASSQELLGVSPAIRRLRGEIHALATSGFRTVLIQGESGVGKEVVAEALRRGSARRGGPFEIFDCPAVPEDHLESELFGTARGAFPGAIDKRGALERAHGGTIFFDEVAAMRREHQAKILRVIEGKSFRRVGGSGAVAVDVAVIAAAHENLAYLAADGRFRHDLYYRLIRDGVLVIPPLRERREDVSVLACHYVGLVHGGRTQIEPAALARLAEYDWPGNVRQLYTTLRIALRLEPRALGAAAVAQVLEGFARGPLAALPVSQAGSDRAGASGVAERAEVSAAEPGRFIGFHAITASTQRRALLEAYEATAGNKTAAGVLLGFHLSPGGEHVPGLTVSEGRRNLALRKFRYWCSRLGISEALERRGPAIVRDASVRTAASDGRPSSRTAVDP